MPFYSKVAKQLVFDLLNAANPQLPILLTDAVVRVGLPKPIANALPAARNTTVLVQANRNMGYVGTKNLTYRRINLTSLFKNVKPVVYKFMASGQPNYFGDYLLEFNTKYGLKLTADDFINIDFPFALVDPADGLKTATVNVTVNSNSLGYLGSFPFTWKNAKNTLDAIIRHPEINGRTFPGGNVFDGNHKYVLNISTFSCEITDILKIKVSNMYGEATLAQYLPDGITLGTTTGDSVPGHLEFLRQVNMVSGTPFLLNPADNGTTLNNLQGSSVTNITLPSALYPEANSAAYAKAIIIKPPAENTWAVGYLIFHHNNGV